MSGPRPRRALRPTLAVRLLRIAAPIALVGATAAGVGAYAWSPGSTEFAYPAAGAQIVHAAASSPTASSPTASSPAASSPTASSPAVSSPAASSPAASASPSMSASGEPSASPTAQPSKKAAVLKDPALAVTGSRYATVDLNLRLDPKQDAKAAAELKAGSKVAVTSVVRHGYRYVAVGHAGRWVKNAYLSSTKPDPATTGSISDRPCASGSTVESGLTPDAIKVHRAVCARYPQVTAYGGRRSGDGGFHPSGRALDSMISDSTVGWQIATWVRAHARQLGVSQVIYSQHIWTVQRGREGWRKMGNRGSRTANHYDHVHVSVYGNRATS